MTRDGFPIWIMPLWLGYGALGLYFVYSRNVARKRRFLVPYMAGVGTLFLAIMVVMGFSAGMVAMAAPLVAGMMWLNTRSMQFCATCGATILRQLPFQRPKYCPKCGTELSQSGDRTPAA